MNKDFSGEEIKNVIRMARVHCPGFSENMFESLMELEKYIADSGYLEVIQGILRLEEEKGVKFTEALTACEELMVQREKLERQVPDLEKNRESIKEQIKQSSNEYEQVKNDKDKARQELEQTSNKCEEMEKKLKSLHRKLEKEIQHMEADIERHRQEADVTKNEIIDAGRLKKAAEKHGFTIEFMLELAKEFAGYDDSSRILSEGLKKHGSLTKYIEDFDDFARNEKSRISGEITNLESGKHALESESIQLTSIISQLQEDIKGEEELRRFYYRYVSVSPLIEQLASWAQVFFVRCTHPVYMLTGAFDANSGNARFWTDKPPVMCPQCGFRNLAFDEKVYRSINWPVGQPGKLMLGEYNG